jgi:Ca2+:H+ antiporter
VAEHSGGAIGSLLNVSFGNAAELVLALFVLAQAQTEIVQAQITGSIIGTTLLFLGISALVGCVTYPRQTFSQERVGLLSTLLAGVGVLVCAVINARSAARPSQNACALASARSSHNPRYSGVSGAKAR